MPLCSYMASNKTISYLPLIRNNFSNVYVGVFFAYQRMTIARNSLPDADLDIILMEICDILNVSRKDILSTSRARDFVFARQLYCYAARQLTGYSLKAVGKKINRDHTTVIHSVNEVKDFLATADAAFMPVWHKYVAKSELFSKTLTQINKTS